MTMTKSDEQLLAKIRNQADEVRKRQTIWDTAKKAEKEAKLAYDECVALLHKLVGAVKEDIPLATLGEADGWKKLKLNSILQEQHALMLLKQKGWKTLGQMTAFLEKKPLHDITGIGEVVSSLMISDVTRRLERSKIWSANWSSLSLHL